MRGPPLLLPGLRRRPHARLLHHEPAAAQRLEAVPHRLRRQGQVRRARRRGALPAGGGRYRRRRPRRPRLSVRSMIGQSLDRLVLAVSAQ